MALADDFMLLALSPDDGKWLIGPLQLQCGLAAALLLELTQAGRIDLDGDAVVVRNSSPVGLPQEDAALVRIAAEDTHDLQWWVGSLRRGVVEEVLARLTEGRVVSEERVRRLGIVPEVRHSLVDPAGRQAVRERVAAVLEGGTVDANGVALLGIAHATGLDKVLFPGADAATIQRRIDEAATGAVGEAVTKVIRQVLVAIIAVLAAVTAAM
jgi:hypothetical protein